MQKGRRRGVALPPGRSFSFSQSDFTKRNLQDTDDKHIEPYSEQNNDEVQNPSKKLELNLKTIAKRERRCSTSSMTLPLSSTRMRKHSFQVNSSMAGRTQGSVQRRDSESHLTVILGSPAVGKTGECRPTRQREFVEGLCKLALIVRYITGRFVHEYDPTLEMIYEKLQEVGNVKGVLQIMDTAGSIESSTGYIRKAEGIIVVYSITDRYSFETAKDYLRTIKEYERLSSPFDYERPTILVGNKRELRRGREVSRDEGRETAKEFGCLFVESSAAYDHNVQKIFINLFLQIHRIKEERRTTIANNSRSFVSSVKSFFQSKKK